MRSGARSPSRSDAVDAVLITDALAARSTRPPDDRAESHALGLLAQQLATDPRGVLQRCAELVMALCRADSAGISILESGGTNGIFRWHAAAGGFAPHLHGTMPREASPCGLVIERDCVLLFSGAERAFPALEGVEPRIHENLLVPWHADGRPVGTLWAIHHSGEGRFDAEDARLLQSLARFAAAAFQMIRALDDASLERTALRTSEEQYRNALDTMSEGFALLDADFTILDVNVETVRLDGRTREEIIGLNHWNAFPGSEHSAQGEMFKRVARERVPAALEHTYRWPDGRTLWIDTRAYPTSNGRIGILWRDITARKQIEEALRESEARFRAMAEQTEIGVGMADREGRLVWTNPRLAELFGTGQQALTQRSIEDITHPDDWPRNRDLFRRMVDAGEPFVIEKRIERCSEGYRWYRLSVSPRRDADQRIVGGITVVVDITDRKQAEATLRESEERHRAILATALDYAIFTTDADGIIDSWSPGAQSVFGWEASEAIGRHAAITYTDEDVAQDVPAQEMRAALREGVAPNVRWHVRKGGQRVFIEGETRPIVDRARGEGGFLKIGRDATERKRWDERQQVLVRELQHRTRNIIAVVLTMFDKTRRSAGDIDSLAHKFRDRLSALARVQGLLSQLQTGDRVAFDVLIHAELSAMGALDANGQAARVQLEGPSGVLLRSSSLQTFALALHELATNATKYGALAQEQGRLSIRWHVRTRHGRRHLHIEWTERGVLMPCAGEAPQGTGFGRELIERALPYQLGADTHYALGPDGITCTIELPISEATAYEVGTI